MLGWHVVDANDCRHCHIQDGTDCFALVVIPVLVGGNLVVGICHCWKLID